MKALKRIALALLALGLLAAIVYAWLPKPVPVDLATVVRGPMRVTVDEDGRTRVTDRYVISAPLMGNLLRITLDAGDAVVPGTVLAQLMPVPPPLLDVRARTEAQARVSAAAAALQQAQAAVDRTRSALANARSEAEAQQRLAATGAVAPRSAEAAALEADARAAELSSARFAARVAQYELENARASLQQLEGRAAGGPVDVRSPVAGRVLRVNHQSAGVVAAGTALVEIGDPASLEIVVDVLTRDAVHVHPGAPVLLEHWGGTHPLHGRVQRVEPSAFTRVSALGVEEQRVNVIVERADPPEAWAALGDGYQLEARIVVWEGERVLQVPASAIFRAGEGWAVFVAAHGRAQRRAVQVGHQNGQQAEILRGLSIGERVIVHPSDQVRDGVRVRAR